MSTELTKLDTDPAKLGFPPTLPIEIALRDQSPREICDAYNISKAEWGLIRQNPLFVTAVTQAHEMLQKEGMSFRVKARLQGGQLLAQGRNFGGGCGGRGRVGDMLLVELRRRRGGMGDRGKAQRDQRAKRGAAAQVMPEIHRVDPLLQLRRRKFSDVRAA